MTWSRVCVLFVVTVSATLRVSHQQTPVSRPSVGSCSLQTLEGELSVTLDPMGNPRLGLVAASYDTGDGSPTPTVRIWNSENLCQASGASRDTLSSVSVVVFYECSMGACGSVPVNRTDQFQFDCQIRVNGGPGNFFSPTKSLGRSVRTPSVGITRLMATPSDQCGDCSQGNVSAGLDTLQPDNVTHCVACRSECQVGLGKCLGLNAGQCCSFYENDRCVINCTAPLVPDAEQECGCGPLVVANTVITFSDGAKIGSVATQTCDASAGFMPSSSSTATRTCTVDGWGGADIVCQIATCSVSDLETGTAGSVVIDPEGGPLVNFGATATFSCDPGYALAGNTVRECTLSGWSGDNPTCTCSSDDLIVTNGGATIQDSPTVIGSLATFACDEGFMLNGDQTRECAETGWLGANPTCTGAGTGASSSPCGTGCIVGIVLAVLGVLILAAILAGVAYAVYSYLNHPDTKLNKYDPDNINGVAKDNPLYVDPEAVVGDGAEAA